MSILFYNMPFQVWDGGSRLEVSVEHTLLAGFVIINMRFRAHLLQDLRPYICTYRSCSDPDQLFSSRAEWLEHEASHRKLWRCPSHGDALYTCKEHLMAHLEEQHVDRLSRAQMERLAKVGEVASPEDRETCPICLKEIRPVIGFQNHLANHLERMAAFALPRNMGASEEQT